MMLEASQGTEPDIARVHFSDGAVTNWHSHPGGQLLYLVSGTGRVGNNDGGHTGITPGTLVQTPAGEDHWHGADEGANAVWLAVTWGTTCWHNHSPLEHSRLEVS
ncbi:cupin domain-containing protein [Arthrobacter deserti]|uniref:Cupin domain-containing protein n=1 Tax=Arthrobacter deserti TaxID=1742687 RepID=A0ABX1JSB0_9MICC|nr:cupin domain-containing protein [Arthrobacter deserti]